jgi:succinyl-diaminopimelate desuccinylase
MRETMSRHPAVELAQTLVRMNSTPGSGGQQAVAEYLADRLDAAGFRVQVQRYAAGHANVVAHRGDQEAPALCLSGHLDTVAVAAEQWTVDPHAGEIAAGRLIGRGAVDMKAGVAAMVHAVERHAHEPVPGQATLLLLTGQEEVGCLGARALADAAAEGTLPVPPVGAMVICEPTSNRPLLGHRGAVWVDVETTGRSCHASTPHLGENAVEKLTACLDRVRAWCRENPSRHAVLGDRTLNIGTVTGGAMRNVVPDQARAELDFRVPRDGARLPDQLREVLGALGDVRRVLTLPPICSDENDPWVRSVRELAGTGAAGRTVARFFTDASVLTPALGEPPTVILGPGSADLAHTVDEWCDITEIETASRLYTALLRHHVAQARGQSS